jgi:hypothetical protein
MSSFLKILAILVMASSGGTLTLTPQHSHACFPLLEPTSHIFSSSRNFLPSK